MNGMKAKRLRQEHAKRWTDEGLPRDNKDWTKEDWIDLHLAMEEVKRKIRTRHANERLGSSAKRR